MKRADYRVSDDKFVGYSYPHFNRYERKYVFLPLNEHFYGKIIKNTSK
jgi:hypothetical protein